MQHTATVDFMPFIVNKLLTKPALVTLGRIDKLAVDSNLLELESEEVNLTEFGDDN